MSNLVFQDSPVWTGCYSGNYDLWCDEAYSHPAKMSPALCYRIFGHLKELGLLNEKSTILDCMGGIGTTALVACSLGYKAVTVELEPKFVSLQKQNKEYLGRKLHRELDWTIIQGDARKLSQLLQENCVTVTSPPYGIDMKTDGGIDWAKANRPDRRIEIDPKTGKAYTRHNVYGVNIGGYGDNSQNIGNLADKPLTVMSPPYEGGTGHGGKPTKIDAAKHITQWVEEQYGNSPGQIENEGESYLSAMSQVYSEIAKTSSCLTIVLKNPTRNGKLRRIDLDTISLLEAGGWTIKCVHQARLFEEQETQDLFGKSHKKVKGRMSFFKRLSYNKGQPIATHEDIIIAVR